jgi:hypothetical protein
MVPHKKAKKKTISPVSYMDRLTLIQILGVPPMGIVETAKNLDTLISRVNDIDDKFWNHNSKQVWIENTKRFIFDINKGLQLWCQVMHKDGLLNEDCIGFLVVSTDGTKGIKEIKLPGRAKGFLYNSLKGGYLLCYKIKGEEVREQFNDLQDVRRVLDMENAKDFQLFSEQELFGNESTVDDRAFVNPKLYDVMLTDVTEDDLPKVANMLGIEYLGEAETLQQSEVFGCLYGPNDRPMINLIVTRQKKNFNVIFLFDTGSPYIFICEKAMQVLGVDPNDNEFNVTIGPMAHTVYKSSNHFSDINVIGTKFLREMRTLVEINFLLKTVKFTMLV